MDKALEHLRKDRGYKTLDPLYAMDIQLFNDPNEFMDYISKTDLFGYFKANPNVVPNLMGKFIIPICTPNGNLASLMTYDLINKVKFRELGEKFIPYSLLSKTTKSDLVYVPKLLWKNFKVEDKYVDTVGLVDGVFDSTSLNYEGMPAFCLMGSTLSKPIITLLLRFKTVIMFEDNDKAGFGLYKLVSDNHPNVIRVIIPHGFKDIDSYLKVYNLPDDLTSKRIYRLSTDEQYKK